MQTTYTMQHWQVNTVWQSNATTKLHSNNNATAKVAKCTIITYAVLLLCMCQYAHDVYIVIDLSVSAALEQTLL
jgi:hypothetical protein